jgi:hypothetical protein
VSAYHPVVAIMAAPPTSSSQPQTRIQTAHPQNHAQPLPQASAMTPQNDDFLRRLSFPTAAETQDVAELARQKFTFGRSTVAPLRQIGRVTVGAQSTQPAAEGKQLGTQAANNARADATSTSAASSVDPRLKFLLGQSPAIAATTSAPGPASAEQRATVKPKTAAPSLSVPDLDQLWKSRTNSNRDISSGSAIRKVVSLYAGDCERAGWPGVTDELCPGLHPLSARRDRANEQR